MALYTDAIWGRISNWKKQGLFHPVVVAFHNQHNCCKEVAIFTNETILNTHQVASFLGAHVETIRRLARRGAIPSFKVGKDWRFEREALTKWVENSDGRQQQLHVLVVDDEPAICKQVRRFLEPVGYHVHKAHQGGQGLAAIQKRPVDLVLLDLKMPGMTGPEFLRRFRQMGHTTPVIIITGYPDSALMGEAMSHGPLLLVPKPFNKEQLLSSVAVVLKPPSKWKAPC